VVLHGVFQSGLQAKESLVHRGRIIPVERDHLRARFTATDHVNALVSMPSTMAAATAEAGSREKPSSGPARLDFIIGVSVAPG
jgi:hypothetical protein